MVAEKTTYTLTLPTCCSNQQMWGFLEGEGKEESLATIVVGEIKIFVLPAVVLRKLCSRKRHNLTASLAATSISSKREKATNLAHITKSPFLPPPPPPSPTIPHFPPMYATNEHAQTRAQTYLHTHTHTHTYIHAYTQTYTIPS